MKKQKILIFGAGGMGGRFYRLHRHRYKIVGFLDNDKEKAGRRLYNKKIYSPGDIAGIDFDKIVIASDYHDEIYRQLTGKLGISEDSIENIFILPPTPLTRVSIKLSELKYGLLLRVGKIFLPAINKVVFPNSGLVLRPMVWLDQLDSFKVKVFRESRPGITVGPHFLHKGQKVKSVDIPEIALFHFINARIGSVGRYVILDDGRIAVERVKASENRYANYSAGHLVMHGNKNALVRVTGHKTIEKGIAITGVSETNYYHWVIEIISQFLFIAELPEKYQDYAILLPRKATRIPSINELISCIKHKLKIVYLDEMQSYQVRNLLVISSPNFSVPNLKGEKSNEVENNYVTGESITFLRHLALENIDCGTAGFPRKIFLARKEYRRNYNQDEVAQMLGLYGFTAVYIEDYSFHEQVVLVNQAEIIVGPSGAAWTNLVFANENAKALCWMSEETGDNACFSNLAHCVGIEMDFLTHKVNVSQTADTYHSSYTVDCDLIKEWIEQNLGSGPGMQSNIETGNSSIQKLK